MWGGALPRPHPVDVAEACAHPAAVVLDEVLVAALRQWLRGPGCRASR